MRYGGVGIAGVIPESVKRAFAIEPSPESTYKDAEHIVILMQENREVYGGAIQCVSARWRKYGGRNSLDNFNVLALVCK